MAIPKPELQSTKPSIPTPTDTPTLAKPIVTERLLERDQKISDHYFVIRVKEEYVSDDEGTKVTPYFKSACRFDLWEDAINVALQTGGQLHFASKNHATAKRMLLDFSPLY